MSDQTFLIGTLVCVFVLLLLSRGANKRLHNPPEGYTQPAAGLDAFILIIGQYGSLFVMVIALFIVFMSRYAS